MVRSAKPLTTNGTLVRLHATVGPLMSSQLVRPRETPLATRPLTHERLLARMSPQVGPQMRVLWVDPCATGIGTREDLFFLGHCPSATGAPSSLLGRCWLSAGTPESWHHTQARIPFLELANRCCPLVVAIGKARVVLKMLLLDSWVVVAVDGYGVLVGCGVCVWWVVVVLTGC